MPAAVQKFTERFTWWRGKFNWNIQFLFWGAVGNKDSVLQMKIHLCWKQAALYCEVWCKQMGSTARIFTLGSRQVLIWSEQFSLNWGPCGLWRGNAVTWNECLLRSLATHAQHLADAWIQFTFAGIYSLPQFHLKSPLSSQFLLRTLSPWC